MSSEVIRALGLDSEQFDLSFPFLHEVPHRADFSFDSVMFGKNTFEGMDPLDVSGQRDLGFAKLGLEL